MRTNPRSCEWCTAMQFGAQVYSCVYNPISSPWRPNDIIQTQHKGCGSNRRGWRMEPPHSPCNPDVPNSRAQTCSSWDHVHIECICVNWAKSISVRAKFLTRTRSGFKSHYREILITPLFRTYLQSNKAIFQVSNDVLLKETLGDYSVAVWAHMWIIRITPKTIQPAQYYWCQAQVTETGKQKRPKGTASYHQPNTGSLVAIYILTIN